MTRIFVSYRRVDSEGYVGRLYDHLLQHFDESELFLDVDTMKPGEDFVATIEKVIGACEALIAVIGPQWLDIRDQNGSRRLDNPEDYVRLEIATALKRDILVIPVLIERATMPRKNDLPDDLVNLTRRNAIELSHDRFSYDVDRIVQAIGGAYGKVVVSVGSSWYSNWRLSTEMLQVFDGRKQIGKIELKYPKPLTVQVKEGVHIIYVVYKHVFYETGTRSNELSFKIKGGQTQTIRIERQMLSPGQYRIVIKPY